MSENSPEKKSPFTGFIRSITSPLKRFWVWISLKIKGLIKNKSGKTEQEQNESSVEAPSTTSNLPLKRQNTSSQNEKSEAYKEAIKLSRELRNLTKRLEYGQDLHNITFSPEDSVEIRQIQEKAKNLVYEYQDSTIYLNRHNDDASQKECKKISDIFKPLIDRFKELTTPYLAANSAPSLR